MKVLVISSYLPYPLFSGGQVRLYNLIKELSRSHEITLICETRPHQTAQDIAEVKKICKEVITVERKKQWSVSNILKAGVSASSFLVTGHTHAELKRKIQEVLQSGKFDLIHVETYYVAKNLLDSSIKDKKLAEIPVVLVEHNIEYQVYEKFRDRSSVVLRPLLNLDIAKIRKEEEHLWRTANALVAVSHEDKNVMEKAGLHPFLVPNGVNTKQFIFKEKIFGGDGVKKILYLGDFKWIQNRDAVTFIIKDIWPKIKESRNKNQETSLKLWIVGRKIPDSIRNLSNDPDILFDEESSSLPTEEIFHQAAVLLAPIRVGGGTSYKILESMSSGTPVVTMQMSADALGAKEGRDVLVGKNAQELSEKCLKILTDASLFKTISKNGRELVEKNYTWEQIGKKLNEVYESVKQ